MDSYLELVRRARKQDASAFARLYQEIYKDLYKFALYTLKDPHDAEDVVSDTVMDAYAGIKGLKKEESFRAWIFRILSNKCRRKLKEYVNKTTELPGELGSGGQDFVEDYVPHGFYGACCICQTFGRRAHDYFAASVRRL